MLHRIRLIRLLLLLHIALLLLHLLRCPSLHLQVAPQMDMEIEIRPLMIVRDDLTTTTENTEISTSNQKALIVCRQIEITMTEIASHTIEILAILIEIVTTTIEITIIAIHTLEIGIESTTDTKTETCRKL
jgi:hypothetical protein